MKVLVELLRLVEGKKHDHDACVEFVEGWCQSQLKEEQTAKFEPQSQAAKEMKARLEKHMKKDMHSATEQEMRKALHQIAAEDMDALPGILELSGEYTRFRRSLGAQK